MTESATHCYWRCPNCRRILGEIVGVRLVILVRRDWHITQPLIDGLEQTCPKCHAVSVWRKERGACGVIVPVPAGAVLD